MWMKSSGSAAESADETRYSHHPHTVIERIRTAWPCVAYPRLRAVRARMRVSKRRGWSLRALNTWDTSRKSRAVSVLVLRVEGLGPHEGTRQVAWYGAHPPGCPEAGSEKW